VSRLAVMAHYDVAGALRPHVRGQVEALAASVDRLVVCTTARLQDDARAWLTERAQVVERANYGYDFFSYKVGLDAAGDLEAFDEVVVCNDSYVFALDSYEPIFTAMAARPCDFWGLTAAERLAPHIQSFFIAFRPWVVGSKTFRHFWDDMEPISKRRQVIRRYEVGMSRSLYDAGFRSGTYFEETPEDRRIARERMRWWAAHRSPFPRSRAEVREWRERANEPWNPARGLADRVLDEARLPYVKIDTLRYDPYKLDAARLLTLCEKRFPARFAGVREFLEETSAWYPLRDNERLHPTPFALEPLFPRVRYSDAR
jgi:Rhamnan synthesis protein F